MRKLSAVLVLVLGGLAWSPDAAQAQSYNYGGGGYTSWAPNSYYYEAPLYMYARGVNGYSYYPTQINYNYFGAANLNRWQSRSYSSNYVPFYYNGQNSRQRVWYSGNR